MKMVDPNEKVNEIVDPNFWLIEDCPSKFKLYKDNKIYGRRLTVPEVKKLSEMNEENGNSVIRSILSNSIKGIAVDDIIVADKIYLIFWLRANTYREQGYETRFKCNLCKKEGEYEFTLEHLKVNYINDDFDKISRIPIEKDIRISYCTIATYDEMIKAKEIKDIDEDILDYAANVKIENLGLMEKYKFIADLDPTDYCKLETYIKKYQIGVQNFIEIKCRNCGGMAQSGITFRTDFFIPQYKFN